jgi:23S rRNA pseudouridine1911/1915/1917 synthase
MSLQAVLSFKVIDESADWLVVDKPAPLIVHPTNLKPEPTLLGGVEQLLSYEMANGARPAVVNRLDRDTSGLVLVAKHTLAARELGKIFERREVEKAYLAIVHGWPVEDVWECAEPILRVGSYGPTPIWVRQMTHPDGKACHTRFRLEQRFERAEGKFALVRCFPETGRMHQIRVHLAHSGSPIVGDKIYSGDGSEYLEWLNDGWTPALKQRLHLPRQALHAARLTMPWRGSTLDWHSELSPDLADFLAGNEVRESPEVFIWSRHD